MTTLRTGQWQWATEQIGGFDLLRLAGAHRGRRRDCLLWRQPKGFADYFFGVEVAYAKRLIIRTA